MNDNESPLHSMNVSLGTKVLPSAPSSARQKPWVVMICSDLGFSAERPQRFTAAALNELLSTHTVVIEGTVETGLPADVAPFHVEYRVTDVKDFSVASLAEKLPLLQNLKRASSLLDDISRKRSTASEGFKEIAMMNLPQSIVQLLGAIMPKGGTAAADAVRSRTAAATAEIDSILSMMDVGAESAAPAAAPAPPADFVAAFTENAHSEFSASALLRCKESIDRLVATLGATVAAQPFFKAAYGSWNALKTLLKLIGRNRDVHCYVHAAPYDAAQRHFADALGVCAAESGVPDLVVWDYPVSIDTATMQQLEHIGSIADRFKTIAVTALDYHDDLYKKIVGREPLGPVIEQPAYIPFRRLRESGASRCLALCAPDAVVQRSASGQEVAVSGAWLLALQWITSCVELSAPFHLQNSSITVFDVFAFPKIPSEVVFDAYRCGLTVIRPNGTTSPRVAFGSDDSPYGSLLFNLVVNRTARLAAKWIDGQDRSVPCATAAPVLEEFLRAELEPYHILSSSDAVTVAVVQQQSLQVTVDSSVTVAGFPVKFQFAFNFRE
jgi:hypothetical protein